MEAGISTACLYPMETEKALDCLLSLDFKLFEIFLNTFSELEPPFLDGLLKNAEARGAKIKSIHPFTSNFESMMLFSNYKRRFEDGMELFRRYFEAANRLKAQIVVLHGENEYGQKHIAEEEYFERYARLREEGLRADVEVAQENVNAFRSQEVGFIRRMRSYLGDSCSFVLDLKQAVRAGQDPVEMCEAMGEQLVHIHLNDNSENSDCLLPGKGTMEFGPLLDVLREKQYRGDVVIEVYRSSFGEVGELRAAKRTVDCEILGKYLQP